MLGNDPNMALSVLFGLGRWEAGRGGGGWTHSTKGGRTPPGSTAGLQADDL